VTTIAGLAEISVTIPGGDTMLKLPNPPWYRRWSIILAGVICLSAIAATLGWRGLQQVASSPSTTASTAPATTLPTEAPTTRAPRSPTTTRAAPGVLWQMKGSDTVRSRLFRAPPSWRIVWSFDCSEFAGGNGGNFKLTGQASFEQVEIQVFDVKASGSRLVNGGGYGRLLITSVCDHWEVRAVRA
jgi:hypothetical protein